jgi:hypothetical protein
MANNRHIPDYTLPDALKFKGGAVRLGSRTSHCLMLRDLYVISCRGFTPRQYRHIQECMPCRQAYSHYMKLRRAEARDKLGLHMNNVGLPDMDKLR